MKKISTFKSANKSQQGDTRKDAQIPLLGKKHPLNLNSLNLLIVLVIIFEEKYHFRSLNLSGDPDRREAVEHSECHFCAPWRGFSRAPHRHAFPCPLPPLTLPWVKVPPEHPAHISKGPWYSHDELGD